MKEVGRGPEARAQQRTQCTGEDRKQREGDAELLAGEWEKEKIKKKKRKREGKNEQRMV